MKVCSVCNKENNNDKGNFCVFCGGKLVEKKENKIDTKKTDEKEEIKRDTNLNEEANKKLKIIIIILVVLLLIAGGLAIYFKANDRTTELQEEISKLNEQIIDIRTEKNNYYMKYIELTAKEKEYKKKIKFFDECVVFVIEGYGRYYFSYDQMKEVTNGESFSFWAYNVEKAKDLGYRAWDE